MNSDCSKECTFAGTQMELSTDGLIFCQVFWSLWRSGLRTSIRSGFKTWVSLEEGVGELDEPVAGFR
jgi:hypothetical protein